MRKTFLILLIMILWFAAGDSFAQSNPDSDKKIHFGFTIEAGRPLGDFVENYDTGFGGNAFISYTLRKEAQLTLSAGYMYFPGISSEDDYFIYNIPDWKAIPIRLGARYFATKHVFLKAETGAVLFMEPGRGTSLILSPGVGLQLHRFQIALKLETWTDGGTVSYAGLNLGYFF